MAKHAVKPVRNFSKEREVIHDLFKLEISSFKKNLSMDKANPMIREYEHVHWFHTVDSHGKVMTHCVAIAGHKHEMKKINDLEWEALASEGHTHRVTYQQSDKIVVGPIKQATVDYMKQFEGPVGAE